MTQKRGLCMVMGMLLCWMAIYSASAMAQDTQVDESGTWAYTMVGDNAMVVSYLGEEAVTAFPSTLDGNPVTHIGEDVFENGYIGTHISIPETVMHIEGNPFSAFDSMALTRIDVAPENPRYEQIDGVLFDKQTKTLIAYPASRVGAYTIPEGTEHVAKHALSGCVNITDVIIPEGVKSIGDSAFVYTSIADLTIPDSMASIGAWAFNETGLRSVSIGGGIKSMGKAAFSHSYGITSVTIADGTTDIGEYAFCDCERLEDVTIPASVVNIGEHAFLGCDRLTLSVVQGSVAEQYAKEQGIAYEPIPETIANDLKRGSSE